MVLGYYNEETGQVVYGDQDILQMFSSGETRHVNENGELVLLAKAEMAKLDYQKRNGNPLWRPIEDKKEMNELIRKQYNEDDNLNKSKKDKADIAFGSAA